jgi:hypothetical protein
MMMLVAGFASECLLFGARFEHFAMKMGDIYMESSQASHALKTTHCPKKWLLLAIFPAWGRTENAEPRGYHGAESGL